MTAAICHRSRSSTRGRVAGSGVTNPAAASPTGWSSSAIRFHAVVSERPHPAEILIAARRLAGAPPDLADPMEPALTSGNTSPSLSATIVTSGGSAASKSIFGVTAEVWKEVIAHSLGLQV